VPDAFGGQFFTADNHPVDRVTGEPVVANQRAVVVGKLIKSVVVTGAAAVIRPTLIVQRVGVEVDHRTGVVDERVADDDRLGAANVQHSGLIEPASGAVGARAGSRAAGVIP